MNKHAPSPPRLLVIDDDNDLRLFLQTFLTEEGYAVDVGATLDEALALIDAQVYHLIITDLLAHSHDDPLRSALAVYTRARPTPVAALTGWNISAAAVARAGLTRLIAKPFDLTNLLTVIASCLVTALNAEQQRQADVVRRYCDAINAPDVDACMATCADDVRIYPPDQPLWETDGPVVGRSACRELMELGLQRASGLHVGEYLIYPQPKGLALRYVVSWLAPEAPSGRAAQAASMSFQFSGERISQITVQTPERRWSALPPETASLPGAQARQS